MKRKIYGVSYKYDFGDWDYQISVFEDKEKAEEWLETEEYDFRTREILTKTEAIKLVGKKAVEEAESVM